MTKQSYIDAIQAGINDLREEARSEQERRNQSLASAFNAASGVIEALEALRDIKGSKFKFELSKEFDTISIETNLQLPNSAKNIFTHVTVRADGEILVGPHQKWSFSGLRLNASEQEAPEKVLRFLAARAKDQGLIR